MIETDKIYQEDCLQTLSRMEDNSVDLIITSPPYNKGTVSKKKTGEKEKYGLHFDIPNYGIFNDSIPESEYEEWQRRIIAECLRVLKPTGSLFYNHKEQNRAFKSVFPKFIYDFPVRQTIVWDRGGVHNFNRAYFFPTIEFIFWIGGKDAYFKRDAGLFQKQVWSFQPDYGNNHPAPFPLALPENCILTCSKEGDVVYDPFMGSGTTAVAAKKHNRHYIGSELSEEYVSQAEERLRKIDN